MLPSKATCNFISTIWLVQATPAWFTSHDQFIAVIYSIFSTESTNVYRCNKILCRCFN